jgi:hypothetical protein
MTETTETLPEGTQKQNPLLRDFTLDEPVMLGGEVLIPEGTKITVRKPDSSAMRGLQLMQINQMDVVTLETLAPRITSPMIRKGSVMSGADLMQFGAEVLDFLLPRAAKAAVSPTA